MTKLLLIAAGGAAGTLLRFFVSGLSYRCFGEAFPWGTLAVNLAGSFLIGLLWAASERTFFPPALAPFLFVGVLGAFTTFSTYTLETLNLLRDSEVRFALLNVVVSNVLGLLFVFAGFALARYLLDLLKA